MKAVLIAVALVAVAVTDARGQITPSATIAPATQTPATQAPVETPRPVPTPGPVLVDGKSTYILVFDKGNTKTVTPTQQSAPANSYFVATPGTLCVGSVNVTTMGTVIPGGAITSKSSFTFTRVGSPVGCAVAISSSAGGPPATVVIQ